MELKLKKKKKLRRVSHSSVSSPVCRCGRPGVRGPQGEAASQQPLHPPPPLGQLHLLRLGLPRVASSLR